MAKGQTPEQRANDIMDEACLGENYVRNGVDAAIRKAIAAHIREAVEEAEEAAFARGQESGASPYDGSWPDA